MEPSELASTSSWLHWLSLIKYIGGAMVVIGVAAELLGDWFSEPLQKRLDDARRLEIVKLTTEGKRLSEEAESAKASIADANARAAEAQLALEKLKTPRSLSRLQIIAIADKLRPFAKTRFDLSVIVGDVEAMGFLGFIADVLQVAGWEWVEYNHSTGPFMNVYNIDGKPNIGQQGWRAISIQVFDDHSNELSPAADALLAALKEEGVIASRDKASDAIPNHDTIHVLIGRKPP